MKTLKVPIIALAAALLAGCVSRAANDEPVTPTPASVPAPVPAPAPATTTVTAPATPAPTPPRESVETSGAYINASAFLNALVESGCQIDKAEYKEVKRGGAIKVTCSKEVHALDVELDDL